LSIKSKDIDIATALAHGSHSLSLSIVKLALLWLGLRIANAVDEKSVTEAARKRMMRDESANEHYCPRIVSPCGCIYQAHGKIDHGIRGAPGLGWVKRGRQFGDKPPRGCSVGKGPR
jgi:hypothetical protein